MRRNTLALITLTAFAAGCNDLSQPVAPDVAEIDLPPPLFTIIEGGEVNTTITADDMQCGETGTVTVTIEGITPPPEDAPIDVMLVLDESGSISPSEFAQVAAASRSFLEVMDEADGTDDDMLSIAQIGVVKFSSFAVLDLGLTFNYAAIYNSVSNRDLSGGTNIGAGLQTAGTELSTNGRPAAAQAVILFSDGVTTNRPFALTQAQALKDNGVAVYTVAVPGADVSLMRALASSPDDFYLVTDFAALEAAFREIAGQITYPAATNLTFTADVPAGFNLVAGSAAATEGTVTEGSNTVTWTVDRLDNETIVLTYDIQHDVVAAPAGGTMVAVTNAQLDLTTPISESPFTEHFDDVSTEVLGCIIEVALDIKPTSCPNPLNVRSRGVTPVAILGTADFDVADIDPETVRLEGVPARRWAMEDVATPYLGELIGRKSCTTEGPDGFMDLKFFFSTPALAAALGPVVDREVRILTINGWTFYGREIEGEDVVWIRSKR